MNKYFFLSLLVTFSSCGMERDEQKHEIKLDTLLAELPRNITAKIITYAFPESAYFGSIAIPISVPQANEQATQEAKEYWQEFNEKNIFRKKEFREFNQSIINHPTRNVYGADLRNPYQLTIVGPNKNGYFTCDFIDENIYKFYLDKDKKIKMSYEGWNYPYIRRIYKAIHPYKNKWIGQSLLDPWVFEVDCRPDKLEEGNLEKNLEYKMLAPSFNSLYSQPFFMSSYPIHYDLSANNDDKWFWIDKNADNIVVNGKELEEQVLISGQDLLNFCNQHMKVIDNSIEIPSPSEMKFLGIEVSSSDPTRILIKAGYEDYEGYLGYHKIFVLCKYDGFQILPLSLFREKVGLLDSILMQRCSGGYSKNKSYRLAKKLLRFVPVNDFITQLKHNYQSK